MNPEQKERAEADVRKARRAQRLLEDPLLVEAFGQIEARLMFLWRRSKAGDTAQREMVYQKIAALQEIRAALTQFLETGKFSETFLRESGVEENPS